MAKEENKLNRYQAWGKLRNSPGKAFNLISIQAESKEDAEEKFKSGRYILDSKVEKV